MQWIGALIMALALAACSDVSVTNNYTINGDGNKIDSTQTGATDRPVDTKLGTSLSATAAASQTGQATNGGAADAAAIRE